MGLKIVEVKEYLHNCFLECLSHMAELPSKPRESSKEGECTRKGVFLWMDVGASQVRLLELWPLQSV